MERLVGVFNVEPIKLIGANFDRRKVYDQLLGGKQARVFTIGAIHTFQ